MMMAWVAILALSGAGQGDRSPASAGLALRPSIARPAGPVAGIRRSGHAPRGTPGLPPGVETCDPEEGVDESWLVLLAALEAGSSAPSGWGRPGSTPGAGGLRRAAPAPTARFPLRC